VWLGLEQDQDAWTNRSGVEGDFEVFAETVSTTKIPLFEMF